MLARVGFPLSTARDIYTRTLFSPSSRLTWRVPTSHIHTARIKTPTTQTKPQPKNTQESPLPQTPTTQTKPHTIRQTVTATQSKTKETKTENKPTHKPTHKPTEKLAEKQTEIPIKKPTTKPADIPTEKPTTKSADKPTITPNSNPSTPTSPPSSTSTETIATKTNTPKPEEEPEDDEDMVKYRPNPSVAPKRVSFNNMRVRAKENRISVVDVPADTPKKGLFEILKLLPGKTSLKDLTIRVKDVNPAQALLLSKILQTCESLNTFRIFSVDFFGPNKIETLQNLAKGILNSPALEELSLENCKISANGWEVITDLIQRTTKLKVLDLKRTKMTADAAENLVKAIKTNPNTVIEHLDWDQNMTNDAIVAHVLHELASVESVKSVFIKNYKVYRHNWNSTLLRVQNKSTEKEEQVKAEIEMHKEALKIAFVPKPMSTFHSNENEFINPQDNDRLHRKAKEAKIMKAYEEFDYLSGATDREVLKRIKLLKKRTQSKRGAVVKLK